MCLHQDGTQDVSQDTLSTKVVKKVFLEPCVCFCNETLGSNVSNNRYVKLFKRHIFNCIFLCDRYDYPHCSHYTKCGSRAQKIEEKSENLFRFEICIASCALFVQTHQQCSANCNHSKKQASAGFTFWMKIPLGTTSAERSRLNLYILKSPITPFPKN